MHPVKLNYTLISYCTNSGKYNPILARDCISNTGRELHKFMINSNNSSTKIVVQKQKLQHKVVINNVAQFRH